MPAANAATHSVGISVRLRSCISLPRLVSRSAQYSSTATFKNSDGWKLNEPSDTHALASLTCALTLGTNGSIINPVAPIRPGTTSRRQKWYGTRAQIHSATAPKTAQIACLLNTRHGE